VTVTTDSWGSQYVWTLSWAEKDGRRVYAFRPEDPIARQAAAAKEHEGGAFDSRPRADMRAMRGLLAEMGGLSALGAGRDGGPDRCEGLLHDVWHGMKTVGGYAAGKETLEMQLMQIWHQMDLVKRKGDLKKLAAQAQRDFLGMCVKVNTSTVEPVAGPITESNLDAFIDACTLEMAEKLFGLMLVQWGWRTRMQAMWLLAK
jgi:hypothetical protein